MCYFIIGESAFLSNEVKHLFIVSVVANIAANQLGISDHGTYVWSVLKKEIPLALYSVHIFLLKRSTNTRVVKDTNQGFEQEAKEIFPPPS